MRVRATALELELLLGRTRVLNVGRYINVYYVDVGVGRSVRV
jgi:hypothetical protein